MTEASSQDLEEFSKFRKRMNKKILDCGNIRLKRFWALDDRAYKENALDEKTLELLGLATSTVLRCDDCITYHIIRCIQLGITDKELFDALNVALVVGGSITIPHIRNAFNIIEECRKLEKKDYDLTTLL